MHDFLQPKSLTRAASRHFQMQFSAADPRRASRSHQIGSIGRDTIERAKGCAEPHFAASNGVLACLHNPEMVGDSKIAGGTRHTMAAYYSAPAEYLLPVRDPVDTKRWIERVIIVVDVLRELRIRQNTQRCRGINPRGRHQRERRPRMARCK